MNIKQIMSKKQYFSSEWDLVEIDHFARNCGITDTNNPSDAKRLIEITSNPEITKKLYKGNLVLGISQRVINDKQVYGCRLQVIMKAPNGCLYCVEDKQFRVNETLSLAEFIYGTDDDKPIYMTENSIQYRFRGVYAESEKVTKEYYADGWEAHSIKIKANCLTYIFKNYRDYNLLTFLLSGTKNHLKNDAYFDNSHCENAA